MKTIQEVLDAVLRLCSPRRVIVYGEKYLAGGRRLKSVNLCIVLDECDRTWLLPQLYLQVDAIFPVQFVLYSTEEWTRMLTDRGSYAAAIEQRGTALYDKTT